MGAYSQLDAELRYGGNAFVEDEADEDADFRETEWSSLCLPKNKS